MQLRASAAASLPAFPAIFTVEIWYHHEPIVIKFQIFLLVSFFKADLALNCSVVLLS